MTAGNAGVADGLPWVVNGAVRVEFEQGVATVVLTRPGQINAINDPIRQGVPEALAYLDAASQVRVILIRGEGERGFCAGADIKEQRAPETAVQVRRRMEQARWIEAVDRVSKPVIAVIHGYCMGGGLELALACDIRFAGPDAVFALPETGLGLIPGGGGTQRLGRVVAGGRALDLLLSGDRLSAAEALNIGLVSRVATSPEALLAEAMAFAAKIAGKPPTASAFAKRAARAAQELDLRRGLDLELDLFALLATTEDAREAATAFKERRQPRFTGQ